jgi:hypothetical protein
MVLIDPKLVGREADEDARHQMSKWQAEKKEEERLRSSFVLSVKVKYQVCRSILLKIGNKLKSLGHWW